VYPFALKALRRKTSRFGERRRGNDFFAFRRHHPGVRFGSTYDSPSCDPAGSADGGAPGDRAGLSTDYLNHYSEILMLIEMASFDEDAVADLSGWQPVDYRAYFERSPLRRAASALAAYEALAPQRRTGFEQTVEALDKLAAAAILALQPPCHAPNRVLIGEVIGPAIRRLIDRCAAFLNSDGAVLCEGADEPQAIIDRLIA
jgi:hypothetical protein